MRRNKAIFSASIIFIIFFSKSVIAGFGEVIQLTVDIVRNKETPTTTMIKDAVKPVATATVKAAEKAVRDVRNAGIAIAVTVEDLVKAMNDSDSFPSRLENRQVALTNPSIKLTVTDKYLTQTLLNLSKNSISTNDKPDNNYVQLYSPSVIFNPSLNIIELKSAGVIAGDSNHIRGALKAKGITIDVAPKIREDNGSYFIDMYGKITYLNIKNSPTITDKFIANAAHYLITQDRPIFTIDITAQIKLREDMMVAGTVKPIKFDIIKHSIIVTADRLIVSAKLTKNTDEQS